MAGRFGVWWVHPTTSLTETQTKRFIHRINLPTPLLVDPASRDPIMVADFEAAFRQRHPSITYLGVSAQPVPKPEGEWEIHIKSLAGKTINIRADPTETVFDVKELLQQKEGIPPDQGRLLFTGSELADDDETLEECGVQNGSVLHLVLKLRGD